MPKVTYVLNDGSAAAVEVADGESLMEGAKNNGIPGITADCGGNLACATCHVYVDPAWEGRILPPSEDETLMLEYASHARPNSRLSCQIRMTDELDGIVVEIPESQG